MIVGDRAPDFILRDHTGVPRTLSEFLSDGPVVLFFFPIASSPICTAQACHFRDLGGEFALLGAHRVGISTDPVDRQARFAHQRSFDYPLLSDSDGVVSELFGVRRGRFATLHDSVVARQTNRHGKHTRRRGLLARLMPVRRTTFVIDTDRTVLKVVAHEVRASVHADQALWFLKHRDTSHARPLSGDRLDSGVDLAFEAPIEALNNTGKAPPWSRNDVRSQILTWSANRTTIAEVAARLSLPLGATRFLVDDLVTQGFLGVRAPVGDTMTVDERRDLLTRTLAGLRAL